MNKPNLLKSKRFKDIDMIQRYKDVNRAVLKFTKAVKDATTYNEMFNLVPSYNNLSKAILSESSNKNLAKSIINELDFMWLLKIKDIHQAK